MRNLNSFCIFIIHPSNKSNCCCIYFLNRPGLNIYQLCARVCLFIGAKGILRCIIAKFCRIWTFTDQHFGIILQVCLFSGPKYGIFCHIGIVHKNKYLGISIKLSFESLDINHANSGGKPIKKTKIGQMLKGQVFSGISKEWKSVEQFVEMDCSSRRSGSSAISLVWSTKSGRVVLCQL